jgi:hypothetical protein
MKTTVLRNLKRYAVSCIVNARVLIHPLPFSQGSDEEDSSEDGSDSEPEPDSKLGKRRPRSGPSARKPVEKKPRSKCPEYFTLSKLSLTPVPEGPRVEVEYEEEVERMPVKNRVSADW